MPGRPESHGTWPGDSVALSPEPERIPKKREAAAIVWGRVPTVQGRTRWLHSVAFAYATRVCARRCVRPGIARLWGISRHMRPFDYLRILARRWWVLVLGALIGALVAYVTQPSNASVIRSTAPKVQYRATNLMLADPTSTSQIARGLGFDRLALLTINGAVRDDAVKRLDASIWNASERRAELEDPTTRNLSQNGSSDSSQGGNQAPQERAVQERLSPNFRLGQGRILVLSKVGRALAMIAPVPDPATGALRSPLPVRRISQSKRRTHSRRRFSGTWTRSPRSVTRPGSPPCSRISRSRKARSRA